MKKSVLRDCWEFFLMKRVSIIMAIILPSVFGTPLTLAEEENNGQDIY